MTVARVSHTPAAAALIAKLRAEHGELLFHQSGGCCDGSAPMCFPAADFHISASDIYLGNLDGVPFYMGAEQYAHWQDTQLIIDVVDGNGGMFSLENGSGQRFVLHTRLFSDHELRQLAAGLAP